MKFKKSLAKQLLFWILLSSSLLTLLITCLHFYVDYKNDISAIDARLIQIESSYVPTIKNALWVEDQTQLEVQITGIKNLPEVNLVQLWQDGKVRLNQGENSSKYIREGRWPITQEFDGMSIVLGELYVVTDLLPVYEKLAEKAMLTMATQGAKTFIISFVIFFIVYVLIARHVSHIAQSMSEFEIHNDKKTPLELHRKSDIDDELKYLVDEYNKMNSETFTAFAEVDRQKNKAEEVNRLKSEFLANISHEVKTPMNGVYGMAHLLSHTPLDHEQLDYVNVIIRSSEHMLELLNSILDFSKIEANKLELYKQPFDLLDLINEISLIFKPSVDEKKLVFEHLVDTKIDTMLQGDSMRLRQVLVNLLSNAFKFTQSGSVSIRATVVETKPNQNPADKHVTNQKYKIQFSVKDTGKGIPLEKQDIIFEKFTQEDNSTTRRYGGTGLGLAICYHLVKLMGGELKLASAPGQGCNFYFTIDLEVTDLPISSESSNRKKLSNLKVLVVDDQEFNSRVLSDLLRGWHMKPKSINDPEKVLQRVIEVHDTINSYDIILIDKCMPTMDGYEVFDKIKKEQLQPPPKIILMSARSDDDDIKRCQEMGIDAFLPMPASQAQIQQILLGVLDTPEPEIESPTQLAIKEPPKTYNSNMPMVLLVEDSAINQQLCRAILKKHNFNLIIANNGQEAVQKWQNNRIDLVIMDCHMPVMNGFEATTKIRKLEEGQSNRVPILAVTASDSDLDKQKCFDVGMDAFISKPYNPESLIAALNKHLNLTDSIASV